MANMSYSHIEALDMFLTLFVDWAVTSRSDTWLPDPLTCFSAGVLHLHFKKPWINWSKMPQQYMRAAARGIEDVIPLA